MKDKELFDRTVAVLVNAYFTDTLEPMSTCGCAVGNLVAAGLGLKVIKDVHVMFGLKWSNGIGQNENGWITSRITIGQNAYYKALFVQCGSKEVESTGYSREEIIEIEKAFMYENYDLYREHINNFDGLMAVIDYLMIVHEASEEEIKEAKNLFVKV